MERGFYGGVLSDEVEIIWMDDPRKYTYLREGCYATTRRRGKLGERKGSRVIGYAVHKKKSEGIVTYERRFWWLENHDRDLDPGGVYKFLCPCEAVIPTSIRVGKQSKSYCRQTKKEEQ